MFIQKLYRKRFGNDRPDVVVSIEDRVRLEEQRRAARRQARSQDQRNRTVRQTLEVVAEVMSNGAGTHPDNDWVHRAGEYYIVRAEDHCASHAQATSARIIFSMRPHAS